MVREKKKSVKMHPAVAKAQHVGKIAHQHNWKGSLESEADQNGVRITILNGNRGDEEFFMEWHNEKLFAATYLIYVEEDSHETSFTHAKALLKKLAEYPDIEKLFEWFPKANRPLLVQKYRRLPFDLENNSNEEIISKLLGCKLLWFGHEESRLFSDVVLPKKSSKNRIQDIGHRKLFHFIGAQAGFRSVMLDTILKAG